MIVPMKKLTLLVLDTEREQALKKLRKLGVLHIEKRHASSEKLSKLNQIKSEFELAENLLREVMPKSVKKQKTPTPLLSEDDTFKVVNEILDLNDDKTKLLASISNLKTMLEQYRPWGNFDPKDFDLLEENGVYLMPASIETKRYKTLTEIPTLKFREDKKRTYFLIWSDSSRLPFDLDPSISLLTMPRSSVSDLIVEYRKSLEQVKKVNARLAELSKYLNSVMSVYKSNLTKIEFEDVRAGMEDVELSEETENFSQMKLAWLVGYLPTEDVGKIVEPAKQNGWAYTLEDPTEEDQVPTKLKNNKFVSIIDPLFDFLDTTPGYFEVDVSMWFLLFFGVFVAMIFGDAAYGSLIFLAVLFNIVKSKLAGKPIGQASWFFLFLSSLTIVWGVITCSWFGIDPQYLPEFVKGWAIEGISSLVPNSVRNKNIMFLSFVIGVVHLVLAHVIVIVRNFKTPKVIADVGSILMLGGMFFVILNMIIDAEKYPLNNFVFIALGVGFALNFAFSNYETSLGKSILESLKNIITMFLGVVNVFSDIMSYIRLWAVGLAGATISMAVNTIMGPMLGKALLFLIGIAIFVFGHGLNVIMAVLSVLVHAVRLNAMEFSSHLGLTWSGFKYKPFKETDK